MTTSYIKKAAETLREQKIADRKQEIADMAKAVAKKNKTEVGELTPDLFAADAGAGVTNLGSEDLAIPFLKILQKMSPELDELDNAKAGDIYNTVTKEGVKGKDGVRVINCAYTLQYIEWEPRGTGTGAPHRI